MTHISAFIEKEADDKYSAMTFPYEYGVFKEGAMMMVEQAVKFADWATLYYGKVTAGDVWYNLCDLLNEEPVTTQWLIEEYFKQLNLDK